MVWGRPVSYSRGQSRWTKPTSAQAGQLEQREGAVGKTAVVGTKDLATKRGAGKVVERTEAATLQGFVAGHGAPGAIVYSDYSGAYDSLPFDHETVKHSLSEYVKSDVRTIGIESLWSMLKRAHTWIFNKLSPKHLSRYVQEFAARHNLRDEDIIDIMASIAGGMRGKRLRYRELIASKGLSTGAQNA